MARRKLTFIGTASHQLGRTNLVPIRTILASRDFVDGFNEVRSGKPFDYDRECKRDTWFYERGRQLAIIYNGPLKEGRYLVDAAVIAYSNARKAGVIA